MIIQPTKKSPLASASKPGLMSPSDKNKLDEIDIMTGATPDVEGTSGLVPVPAAGDQDKFLKADGTWGTPTDTKYSEATTSKAGLMSASDKAKLDETRLWRRCVVGQSSGTTTNPYYKFASISMSDAYYDAAITFKVSLNYGDHSACLGILTAHVRTSGTAYWDSSELVWEYALSGIDTSKFILCHNTSTKPTIVELWVKADRSYALYHFDVLTEGTRTTSNNSLWTLYNKSSAGSEAALPSGYVQQTSTLRAIKNDTSGKASSADKLTKNAGAIDNPVYFKDGIPVACDVSAITGSGSYNPSSDSSFSNLFKLI